MNLNRYEATGYVEDFPDMSMTESLEPVLRFVLAVPEPVEPEPGVRVVRTHSVDCVVSGDFAERLFGMLSRGMHLSIAGHLRVTRWIDTDGFTAKRYEVAVTEAELDMESKL